jgi:hypothetical protein
MNQEKGKGKREKEECENVPKHILPAQTFAETFAGLVDNEGLAGG